VCGEEVEREVLKLIDKENSALYGCLKGCIADIRVTGGGKLIFRIIFKMESLYTLESERLYFACQALDIDRIKRLLDIDYRAEILHVAAQIILRTDKAVILSQIPQLFQYVTPSDICQISNIQSLRWFLTQFRPADCPEAFRMATIYALRGGNILVARELLQLSSEPQSFVRMARDEDENLPESSRSLLLELVH
jgi:uncharacterized protein YunC (DUF1805 family)